MINKSPQENLVHHDVKTLKQEGQRRGTRIRIGVFVKIIIYKPELVRTITGMHEKNIYFFSIF